jgi:cyclohexadieny/prephenate dehydrogenase
MPRPSRGSSPWASRPSPLPRPVISQLTILAPGLLGGSIARAAREREVARRIVIWARRPETRPALAAQPWCDLAAESAEAAVHAATLVVIAAPVDAILTLAKQIAPHLARDAVVTDVGSVKGHIAQEGPAAVGKAAHFVGSHPMAGSEKTGWEHGSATLFDRRTCFVTPVPSSDRHAMTVVSHFWRDLGGEVATVDPDLHDRIVAHISHLPQALASTLCAFLATQDPAWRNWAGGGLKDTTRIAGSDPQLWRSIFEQNREPLLAALRQFQSELGGLERALTAGDWAAVTAVLARGQEYRQNLRA